MSTLQVLAVVQLGGILLLVALFSFLSRQVGSRPYFQAWAWAWFAICLSTLTLVLRYTALPLRGLSPLSETHPTVKTLYLVYQMTKLAFLGLLLIGVEQYGGRTVPKKSVYHIAGAVAVFAPVSVMVSRRVETVLLWQCAAAVLVYAWCSYRLLGGRWQHKIGMVITGFVCAFLAVLALLYVAVFFHALRAPPGRTTPFALLMGYNALGYLLLGYGMTVTIIEDMQAEAAADRAARLRDVAASEARLAGVIRSAIDAIITVDGNGSITLFNAAAERIFGRSAAECYRRELVELVAPSSRPMVEGVLSMRRAGSHEDIERLALLGQRADGDEFPMELSCSALESLDRSQLVVVVRDTTEIRRAQEDRERLQARLAESEKLEAVGQVVSGVAHELNNPLAAILNFSEILLNEEMRKSDRATLSIIREQTWRCRSIVRNLLAFVREGEAHYEIVSLPELVERASRVFEPEFSQLGIELTLNASDVSGPIDADPERLEQMLINLISNAVHAVGQFGKIAVVIRDADDWTELVVEDSGPGIPQEFLLRIFEPFFSSKPAGHGTGLGLSVSQAIVQQHGGSISAMNRLSPERGARFVVRLPRLNRNILAEPSSGHRDRTVGISGPGTPEEPGPRMLIIDDEVVVRTALRRFFQKRDWVVDEAADGSAALSKLLAVYPLPNVIVSDLRMNGMSGIELHDWLALNRPALLVRFVFITGDIASAGVAAFMARTRQPVLEKPFELPALLAVVEKIRRLGD